MSTDETASSGARRAYLAELAYLGPASGIEPDVLFDCDDDGTLAAVTPRAAAATGAAATRLSGLVLPGFVNAHSHAFHRVLRGVSEAVGGGFYDWRALMYDVAGTVDPDSYRDLAAGVYAENVLAGYCAVGEFHYLHHGPSGVPYRDRNEMGVALAEAAAEAGVRLTLLDTCYLQAGADGAPLEGVQLRFGDGCADRWAERVDSLAASPPFAPGGLGGLGAGDRPQASAAFARVGAAVHSVRAAPPIAIAAVAAHARRRGWPLHVHLSEQKSENDDCMRSHGATPTALLAATGALSAATTAVHATHVTSSDISELGRAAVSVCACPTTERDLGDGVGPFSRLARAGASLCIGSDSHAVVDAFEETRAIELDERLVAERRGLFPLRVLLAAATEGGARAIGEERTGLVPGAPADLVAVRLDSPRLAGALGGWESGAGEDALVARVVFGAAAADVDTVVVGGRVIVEGGAHVALGPARAVAGRLDAAITQLLGRVRR